MSDIGFALGWVLVLAVGVVGSVGLHHLGLATTYVRDLLHVGTGVWVLGWPWWNGWLAPLSIVVAALAATAAVPVLARSSRVVARFRDSVASGDERFTGLVLYTLAYASLTVVAFAWSAFAAGAGLLALSLGDGLGGAVGRRFGRHRYRVWGAKAKSLEGSLTVALAAGLGVLLACWRFDVWLGARSVVGLGLGAAVAEALSPRGTDNLVVPVVVTGIAHVVSS